MASKKNKSGSKAAQKTDTSMPKERNLVHLQMILSGKSKSRKMRARQMKRNRTRAARNNNAIKEQFS